MELEGGVGSSQARNHSRAGGWRKRARRVSRSQPGGVPKSVGCRGDPVN